MKLQEKFSKARLNTQFDSGIRFEIECENIADDFAIEFAEWISETTTTLGGGLWMIREEKLFVHKNQLLEIFKKEKGL